MTPLFPNHFLALFAGLACSLTAQAGTLLVEAEQFAETGGWKIDTEFIETMGSPYLIAHGLGKPVANASTKVEIPAAGSYKVWVRTLDWSESIGRPGGAGRFSLTLNGKALGGELGDGPGTWHWQEAGSADLPAGTATLALNDLTGFDGRVDAILLSSDPAFTPPAECKLEDRIAWKIPGAPGAIENTGDFDLVVIGGGYGGLGAAISAARMGCKVALVQNREVLGGNGSSEIRVWAKGNLPPSPYRMSDIVREISRRSQSLARPRRAIRR